MTKEKLLSVLFMLIVIPATILLGMYLLHDRKYYFISVLIILEIFIPFCFAFERHKPEVRELVIISVMAAAAAVGRAAFYMIPQFQAMTAIIIISGIALGADTGFLIGAVAAFVSSFFMGQGPWTPWQMFAWGMMGFLPAIIIRRTNIKGIQIILAALGFVITVAVYGVIMNIQAALSMMSELTWSAIGTSLWLGLPYDLIHAVSTAVFLLILGRPMLGIMDRIKIKYEGV